MGGGGGGAFWGHGVSPILLGHFDCKIWPRFERNKDTDKTTHRHGF